MEINLKMKDKKQMNNVPEDKIGDVDEWAVGRYTSYRYKVFDKTIPLNDIYYTKVFDNRGDATDELFYAIDQGMPEGRLPYIKGIRDDKVIYGDALDNHLLVAGQTRSGKTNNARVYALSLMYFSHPEYMKLVILDPKAAAFKSLGEIANVATSYEDIVYWINKLTYILKERREITGNPDYPAEDAKEANEQAYKSRNKNMIMPYICVIFDEFADFSLEAKKEDKEVIDNIQLLASQGLGLGIQMKFLTQAPYKESIKGFIKNNFEGRATFKVGDYVHEQLILGKRGKEDEAATMLKQGYFLQRENGQRIKYRAPLCTTDTLQKAALNLENRGFNYKLEN